MKCPKCGKEIINDQAKCECGFEMVPKEKNKAKKYLLIGVLAVLAIIIVVSLFVPMDKSDHDYIVGESDGGYYLIDAAIPKKEPVLIAECKGSSVLYEYNISSDNTKLLYANNGQHDPKSDCNYYELYYYDIDKGTSTLVDKDVFSYIVNDAFDTVTYYKGTGGEVWQKKGSNEPEKLLDGAYKVKVSNDLSTLFYTDKNDSLYTIANGGVPELISENAQPISFGDKSVLYCEDNSKLVKYENGTKTQISDNYDNNIYMTTEGGYFLCDKKSVDIDKYFVDDMLESDKNIKISDTDAYDEKLQRDAIRLDIAIAKQEGIAGIYSLYYFDGEKANLVSKNVLDTIYDAAIYSSKEDDKLIGYRALQDYKLSKITMSEFYNGDMGSIEQVFYDALSEQSNFAFAKDGKALGDVSLSEIDSYLYNKDDSTIYVHTCVGTDDAEESYKESYYTVKIADGTLSEPKLYAENASADISDFVGNDLVYCKYSTDYVDAYLGENLLVKQADNLSWIDDSILYIDRTDEDGKSDDLLYAALALNPTKLGDEYDSKKLSQKGAIVCYSYETGKIAVMSHSGIVTNIDTDISFTDCYIPQVYENYYEMVSPAYYEELW